MPSRAPISSIARSSAAGVAEAQPVGDAGLHRPRDRAAGRDRVQAELVAARARLQDLVGIVDARPAGRARTRSRTPRARSGRPCVVMIRSQPIEHDAQLSRTAARSSSASVVVSVPKLRPGSAESALNVSRLASVPRSRYFAVAGPNERARRSLRGGEHRVGIGDRATRRRAHGDGLEPLGAEHGAEAAAAGVAAVVRDRRVAHEPLAGGPDRGDPVGGPELLAQPLLGLRGGQAPEVAGVDDRARRRRRRSAADGVSHAPRTTIASLPVSLPAIAKWLDASASLRRSVSGDFATTANFALVVSGVPTSGENTNASGASGASGSTPAGASSDSRCVPEPDTAERGAQDGVVERQRRAARRRRGRRRVPCRSNRRGASDPLYAAAALSPRRRRP